MFTFLDLKEPVTSISRSSTDCGVAYSSMRDEGYCCEEAVDWTTALARLAKEWRTRASSGDECWNLDGVCSAENVVAMAEVQNLKDNKYFSDKSISLHNNPVYHLDSSSSSRRCCDPCTCPYSHMARCARHNDPCTTQIS